MLRRGQCWGAGLACNISSPPWLAGAGMFMAKSGAPAWAQPQISADCPGLLSTWPIREGRLRAAAYRNHIAGMGREYRVKSSRLVSTDRPEGVSRHTGRTCPSKSDVVDNASAGVDFMACLHN